MIAASIQRLNRGEMGARSRVVCWLVLLAMLTTSGVPAWAASKKHRHSFTSVFLGPKPFPKRPTGPVPLKGLHGQDLHAALVAEQALSAANIYEDVQARVRAGLGYPNGTQPADVIVEALLVKYFREGMQSKRLHLMRNHTGGNETASGRLRRSRDPPQAAANLSKEQYSSMWHALEVLLASPEHLNATFGNVWELRYNKTWHVIAQARAIALGQGAQDVPMDYSNITTAAVAAAAANGTATSSNATAATSSGSSSATSSNATSSTDGTAATDGAAGGTTPVASIARQLLTLNNTFLMESGHYNESRSANSTSTLASEIRVLSRLWSRLPKRYCMAYVRRYILGCLVRRRVADHNHKRYWTREDQAALTTLFLQMYLTHRNAAVRKGAVEFFHISKAGGTSFCQLAKVNGCHTHDFSFRGNCLIREFDDLPRWVSRPAHRSFGGNKTRMHWYINYELDRNTVFCNPRKKHMEKKGFTMYAHEYTLIGGKTDTFGVHVCPNHFTIMQVRDPETRLKSHLRWIYGLYQRHEGPERSKIFWPNTTTSQWFTLAPAVVHNYYTRSILGEGVYHLHPSNITLRHSRLAHLMVLQFDMLLVLEKQAEAAKQLRVGLGWQHTMREAKLRTSSASLHKSANVGGDGGPRNAQAILMGETTVEQLLSEQQQQQQQAAANSTSSAAHNSTGGTGGTASQAGGGQQQAQQLGSGGHTRAMEGASEEAAHGIDHSVDLDVAIPPDFDDMLKQNQFDLMLYPYMVWVSHLDTFLMDVVEHAMRGNYTGGLELMQPRMSHFTNSTQPPPMAAPGAAPSSTGGGSGTKDGGGEGGDDDDNGSEAVEGEDKEGGGPPAPTAPDAPPEPPASPSEGPRHRSLLGSSKAPIDTSVTWNTERIKRRSTASNNKPPPAPPSNDALFWERVEAGHCGFAGLEQVLARKYNRTASPSLMAPAP